MEKQQIGDRLRKERERLDLTQAMLAIHGGVKKLTQLGYEKGQSFPNAEYLGKVAEFGVDVLYVITGHRSRLIESTLTAEERALLDNYRHANPARQASLRDVSAALASASIKGKDAGNGG